MNEEVENYLRSYDVEIVKGFMEIRKILNEINVTEKMWARLPSYYLGERFVRIIPFKDHLNIEATAIKKYESQLQSYTITPKGMLQIYTNQIIPSEILKKIFIETLKTHR